MSPPPGDSLTSTSFSRANRQSTADAPSLQRPPFYARFVRRPRTSSNANPSSSFAASTSNLLSPPRGSSFSDLLRSSSSSHVHLYSPADRAPANSISAVAAGTSGDNGANPSRSPVPTGAISPNPDRAYSGANMTSTNASAAQGGGAGSALGRMFRRYSQGTSGRGDPQRPSTRDRDRDSFNVSRNISSSAIDRDTGSPMRTTTNASVVSPSLPRSGSQGANLTTLPSMDGGASITGSHTLTTFPPASAAAALPSSPSPAVVTAATASADAASVPVDDSTASQAHQATADGSAADQGTAAAAPTANTAVGRPLNGMHRIRLVPHLEATRSLHFEPIERDLKEGAGAVKVGRFTDRQPPNRDPVVAVLAGAGNDASSSGEFASTVPSQTNRGQPGARGGAIPISGSHGGGGRIDSSRIAFKSKVVSRGHAEIWCEPGGKFFIRDTKSSSGTFLNHIRLSGPNMESRPFAIKDGDVVQLGVDYQGGTEEIYRCVKMRVELNRGWQREANQFNVNALRQLRALQGTPLSPPTEEKGKSAPAMLPTNRQGVSVTDCCICLFSVTVCQALFIAPCSHVFHYKCIRPLLNLHHPGFSCPLCRTFADLDADVEEDEAWQEALMQEAAAAEARLAQGKQPVEVGTPAFELEAPIAAATPPSLGSALVAGADGGGGTAGATGSPTTSANAPAPRLPLGSTASPLLADLQSSQPITNPSLGRGTAALSKRKNDWARPDTAVGSSAGPLAGDETFAVTDPAETTGLQNEMSRLSAELGEMVVTDRLLNEDSRTPAEPAGSVLGAALQRTGAGASETGSPLRRGSGPIAIGSSERTLHAHRATPATAGPAALGSLEEGWPATSSIGGFSPGLDEAGTPLNHTFLSTLAEAPHATAASSSPSPARDFPPGRSAPAQTLVPAVNLMETSRLQPTESSANDISINDAVGRRNRSSDGGEDVDTAEEETGGPAAGAVFGNASGNGIVKGKARLEPKFASAIGDVHHDLALAGDGSAKFSAEVLHRSTTAKPPGARGRSRSRSRSGKEAAGPSDSDDQEAAPFQPYDHPPVPRTGPNLNASAYMSHQLRQVGDGHGQSQSGGGGRQANGDRGANHSDHPGSPTSPTSESKMARFKRRISHAM